MQSPFVFLMRYLAYFRHRTALFLENMMELNRFAIVPYRGFS